MPPRPTRPAGAHRRPGVPPRARAGDTPAMSRPLLPGLTERLEPPDSRPSAGRPSAADAAASAAASCAASAKHVSSVHTPLY